MKRLDDAAREAGIHRIECPQCGQRFNTTDLFKRLFGGILALVQKGERVNVPRFGIFQSITYAAKSHKSPIIKGPMQTRDSIVLKFKQSAFVRRLLNPPDARAVARGKKAAEHKKHQQAKQDEALKKMRDRERAAKAKKKAAKKGK